MIVECVGVKEFVVRNHFSLHSSTFMDFFSGLMIEACALSINYWLIVSSGWDGDRVGGKDIVPYFIFARF